MEKRGLTDFVPLEALIFYQFNWDECSMSIGKGDRSYTVVASSFTHPFDSSNSTQLIIAHSEDRKGRREWFFGYIPDMSREDALGPKYDEYMSRVGGFLSRKHRVAGRDLVKKLEEATGETYR